MKCDRSRSRAGLQIHIKFVQVGSSFLLLYVHHLATSICQIGVPTAQIQTSQETSRFVARQIGVPTAEDDDGLGIGSISLTENYPSSENKSDHGSDYSDGDSHWPERDWDVSYAPCTPPSSYVGIPFKSKFTGPCLICGRAHDHEVCEYRFFCPIGQEVGEGFVVVCPCNVDVENGKCPRGCSYKTGRAGRKITLTDPSIFFGTDTVVPPIEEHLFPKPPQSLLDEYEKFLREEDTGFL